MRYNRFVNTSRTNISQPSAVTPKPKQDSIAAKFSGAHLQGLMFTAKRLVDGLYAGRHLSPQPGMGLDFHDYRPYTPGDSLADLDWKLLGRTDRCYIRRYRRQSDLQIYIMLDATASMGFRGLSKQGQPLPTASAPSKFEAGATLAAAIAFLTIRQSDCVGLGLFTHRLLKHLPPAGTHNHLQQICASLEKHPPTSGQGDITASLKQLQGVLRRRGLIVLIADLLDEPATFFQGIAPLRHAGHEVIVLQMLTKQERDLGNLATAGGVDALKLVDIETRMTVPTQLRKVQRDYARLMEEHIQQLRQGCLARGMDHQLVCTDDSPIEALRQYLSRRASVRR